MRRTKDAQGEGTSIMQILIVTGAMGSGKSTTAQLIEKFGFPRFDSDATVHDLYRPNGGAAIAPITALFGADIATIHGIDRQRLARCLTDADKIASLEAIVHPLVTAAKASFIATAAAQGHAAIIVDVPLYFETLDPAAEQPNHIIIVTQAPEALRRTRIMARENMTDAKYRALERRQIAADEKAHRADYIVTTDGGQDKARDQIIAILQAQKLIPIPYPAPDQTLPDQILPDQIPRKLG